MRSGQKPILNIYEPSCDVQDWRYVFTGKCANSCSVLVNTPHDFISQLRLYGTLVDNFKMIKRKRLFQF